MGNDEGSFVAILSGNAYPPAFHGKRPLLFLNSFAHSKVLSGEGVGKAAVNNSDSELLIECGVDSLLVRLGTLGRDDAFKSDVTSMTFRLFGSFVGRNYQNKVNKAKEAAHRLLYRPLSQATRTEATKTFSFLG